MKSNTEQLEELEKADTIVKVFCYPILWVCSVFLGTKAFFRAIFKPTEYLKEHTTLIDIHESIERHSKKIEELKAQQEELQ